VQRKLVFNSCNGRCELQKSMKKFEDNEKKMQNNLKEKFELVYVQHFSENKLEALKYIQTNEVLSSYFSQKPISVIHSTFHPPTLFI
jgi:thioredoxin-related protein